jgi:hypothetical protein
VPCTKPLFLPVYARPECRKNDRCSIESDTPAGRLRHLGPTVRLPETSPYWARPSVPLGYNEPAWPARAA